MLESNLIMPPEFILTRGEAYKYYLAHNGLPYEEIIRHIIFKKSVPLKELCAIQNDEAASVQLATAINLASKELTRFIQGVKQKGIKTRKATNDRKAIFALSNYPLLRKDWKGVLLKQTDEETKPQYLDVFNCEQYDADMADVKMISSDGVTFLMNKLYLASASVMFRNIFSEIIPTLDDGAVILIQTNIHSEELKSVVQFIMFGQVDCDEKCPKHCKGEAIFELLQYFGVDISGNSFTLSHSKKSGQPEEEMLQFSSDHSNEFQVKDMPNFKDERELEKSFDEPQDNVIPPDHFLNRMECTEVPNFNEYTVSNEKFIKSDILAMPRDTRAVPSAIHLGGISSYTDFMTGMEMEHIVKQEVEAFLPSDGSMDSGGSTGSITRKKIQKRKGKLQSKKNVHANGSKKRKKKDVLKQEKKKMKSSTKEQKPFMELSREGQKARVGDFFDSFLNESQILGISDGSFAGYLGYRATIDGEPWVASTFKWLHEGITGDEKLKDTENKASTLPKVLEAAESITTPFLGDSQDLSLKARPPFLDLTYEEKMNQVGEFFDLFLEKAEQLQISPTCFAAYLGMKVTYVTDRLAASTFNKLYDGSDKREKWRFSLGPKEVKCAACGKKFQGEKMTFLSIRLKGHMKTVHPGFDYKCIACGEPVETWENHVTHCNEVHNGEMKMQCNSCDLIFNSRAEIRSHKLTYHTSSRPEIVCAECGKKLTPASMEVHMKTEHGQEHVACPKCPKILKHPIALERHLKTNHDECQCEECGKVCNSSTGLKRHMLTTHTPDNLKVKQKLRNSITNRVNNLLKHHLTTNGAQKILPF